MKKLQLIHSQLSYLTCPDLDPSIKISKVTVLYNREPSVYRGLSWPQDTARGGMATFDMIYTARSVSAAHMTGGWLPRVAISAGHNLTGGSGVIGNLIELYNCQTRAASFAETQIADGAWLVMGQITLSFQHTNDDLGGNPFKTNAERGFYFEKSP